MSLTTVLVISFIFISVFGTLLHFTHNWLKNGVLLHIFSAINESTWEHMKLLIAPTLIVLLFQFLTTGTQYKNIFFGILILLIVEILTIPLIFEPLRLIIKKVPLFLSILIFYISILFGLLSEYFVLRNRFFLLNETYSLAFILLIVIIFGIFTYYPPRIFLFKDPITGKHGDTKHR